MKYLLLTAALFLAGLLLTAGIVVVFAAGCVVCLLKCREKKA